MITTRAVAVLCAALLAAENPYAFAQQPQPAAGAPDQSQKTLSQGQLESLVAPIALYPDPILSQALVASTYPLEIVEAGRWLSQNSNLTGKALADAAAKQPWDASVQALVVLPDVLKRLDQNVTWTSDLGNAFLAQQQDVMDAIQRLRQRASEAGALKSNESTNRQHHDREQPAVYRDTTGESGSCLRTAVQPRGSLGTPATVLSVPAHLLPALHGAVVAAALSHLESGWR